MDQPEIAATFPMQSLVCGNGGVAPGAVWAKRTELASSMQQLLECNPVVRVANDTVCLDTRDVLDLVDGDTRALLDEFRCSLTSMNVAEWDSPHVARKRKRVDEEGSLYSKFRIKHTRINRLPRLQEQNADFMTVPVGASSRDYVTTYDTKSKKLTKRYTQIPARAYEGMQLPAARQGAHIRLIMVDGDGYKTGGSTAAQHAARLYVHRQHCRLTGCAVLGCGLDPSFSIFKNAATEQAKAAYECQWKRQRKQALREHADVLNLKANRVI